MSKKGYILIASKQISGNRNNVLVLLYTFNTSVWSDGLQGRFTRWNLCSFRCQRQYIHVCVWCVCYLCVHAEVSVVAAVWGRCWTSQSGSSCCSSDSWGQKPNSVNPSTYLKKTIRSAEHLNISSEPHTDVDQWLLWTSPNLHLVTFFLSELWSHALWKHSFTSHALMNVICTASKNGRASPAALRH